MQYKAKMVRLKTEMKRFKAKRQNDSWINHTAENQSDCKDRRWFQNGYNQSINQSISQSIKQENLPEIISETGGQSYAHIPKPEECDSHT